MSRLGSRHRFRLLEYDFMKEGSKEHDALGDVDISVDRLAWG